MTDRRAHIALITLWIVVATACNRPDGPYIAVNLQGYHPDHEKQALLVNAEPDSFEVIRTSDDHVVYSGLPVEMRGPDRASGDSVAVLDFSPLRAADTYYLRSTVHPEIRSAPFRIADDLYEEVTRTVLKSFYYHRCGTDVHRSEWGYDICHLDDAPYYSDPERRKDVQGGWHDAGDYNKFVTNTALSTALLLYLFELDPSAFPDGHLEIPESGNGIPDLLDEVSWSLRWLLRMQRPDGSVYHKVSQKRWTGEYLPDQDPETRYLFEPSSSATATFAAVTALAARLMEEYTPDFANQLRNAALDAWHFLLNHPEMLPEGGFRNPPDVHGGAYHDPDDSDERMWAAAELFRLTGESDLLTAFDQMYRNVERDGTPALSWKEFHVMGYSAMLQAQSDTLQTDPELLEELASQLISGANRLLEVHQQNSYLNLNRASEYYWGSNSVGLGRAFHLIQTYRLTSDNAYRRAALDQLHFVLGRNPLNLSQVTGVGSRSVQNPYHQLSEMGGFDEPVPGMLVGGPNNRVLLGDRQLSEWPAKSYEDRFNNFYVNEPAINFTAVMAYVSGYFSITHEPIVLNLTR